MTNNTNWEERLRDLYLTTSPDKDGLYTKSITMSFGTLTFEQANAVGRCEFYLTTKNSLENFIKDTIQREVDTALGVVGKEMLNSQKHHKEHKEGENPLAKEHRNGWNRAMNYAAEIIRSHLSTNKDAV